MANDSTAGGGGSSSGDSAKNSKKANLLDQNSVKHLLDETISEVGEICEVFWFPVVSLSLCGWLILLGPDRDQQRLSGRREAEQSPAADRGCDHRHCSARAVLPEEVPCEQGHFVRLYWIISFISFE